MARLVILLSFVVMLTQSAFAQGEAIKPSYYLNTGFSVPSSPEEFSDYWKMGFSLGAGIGYPLSPIMLMQGSLDYSRFPFDDDRFLRDSGYSGYGFSISGGSATIITVSADLKARPSGGTSSIVPYVVGGFSYFRLATSNMTISYQGQSQTLDGESDDALGLAFGAGIEYAIGPKMSLFAEGRYGVGFTEGESTQHFPVKLGIIIK